MHAADPVGAAATQCPFHRSGGGTFFEGVMRAALRRFSRATLEVEPAGGAVCDQPLPIEPSDDPRR